MDLRSLGILIADRQGRSMVLKTPLRVIGLDHTYEADTCTQVLTQLHTHSIDVLIAGFDLPPTGLPRLIEYLRSSQAGYPKLAIIALIPADHPAAAEQVLEAGANQTIVEPVSLHELEQAIIAAVGQTHSG